MTADHAQLVAGLKFQVPPTAPGGLNDPNEPVARQSVHVMERRPDREAPMVNPLEIMPVLALALILVLLPAVADRP